MDYKIIVHDCHTSLRKTVTFSSCFLKILLARYKWNNHVASTNVAALVNGHIFIQYFIGRVTLFFADNNLTEYRITIWSFYTIFLDPDVFFNSHTMFINTSLKSLLIHLVTFNISRNVYEWTESKVQGCYMSLYRAICRVIA